MAPTQEGRSLAITLGVSFGIQLVFYIISAPLKTEKLYDISGSLTYLACVLIALFVRQEPISLLSDRQIIAASFVVVWTLRLGIYLFKRVLREGKDARFDELKTQPLRFAVPWFLQAVWVFLTAFPVYILLGIPGVVQPPLGLASDIIGIIVWTVGFLIEVVSDLQKDQFKQKNPKSFMCTGIWKYSRHPNYFGEILLWIGVFIFCAGGFSEDWQYVSIISPVFVFCLIVFVSGIPLLEKSAEKRYGQLSEYQAYKSKTHVLLMLPPSVAVKINKCTQKPVKVAETAPSSSPVLETKDETAKKK